jgi:hypothetical protein
MEFRLLGEIQVLAAGRSACRPGLGRRSASRAPQRPLLAPEPAGRHGTAASSPPPGHLPVVDSPHVPPGRHLDERDSDFGKRQTPRYDAVPPQEASSSPVVPAGERAGVGRAGLCPARLHCALRVADGPLDRKHAAALAAGEGRRRPRAAPDRAAHPDRAEPAAQPVGQVTDLPGPAGGQGHEGPDLAAARVPQSQLSVKGPPSQTQPPAPQARRCHERPRPPRPERTGRPRTGQHHETATGSDSHADRARPRSLPILRSSGIT